MHRFTVRLVLLLWNLGLWSLPEGRVVVAFAPETRRTTHATRGRIAYNGCTATTTTTTTTTASSLLLLLLRPESQRPDGDDDDEEEPEIIRQMSTIKIDDGGSDLTDRFKYKVRALMGNFDPPDADRDTEDHAGNILGAMLTFPTVYTFHAVGKHAAGDVTARRDFVRSVRRTVRRGAGLRDRDGDDGDDDDDDKSLRVDVVPRSSKFVKVSVSVTVESGAMVSEIYRELGALTDCVMQF